MTHIDDSHFCFNLAFEGAEMVYFNESAFNLGHILTECFNIIMCTDYQSQTNWCLGCNPSRWGKISPTDFKQSVCYYKLFLNLSLMIFYIFFEEI